ncbi:uncharacterized protein LOC100378784 [Saccoglossus kowalevskii]|uniref:Uncharacterized protein LOC100378784 n=1 Tax=Saccoglossus kowalevskii TaxID=10224 RepID=A0ABM0GYM0_SACKO|nr:PREDICTED: uncharacterized protein LOC100378784 [Saccoglossus kowalevskii]
MPAGYDLLQHSNPRKSDMTWWSRHDPVKLPQGRTDHWSKMKIKCTTFDISAKNTPSLRDPYQTLVQKRCNDPNKYTGLMRPKSAPPMLLRYNQDGTVKPLTDRPFHQHIVTGLNGQLPGSYAMKVKPRPSTGIRRTSFNTRAKEGFKYWPMERPKPTKFGRYGIGSRCTVLGLGNASRT